MTCQSSDCNNEGGTFGIPEDSNTKDTICQQHPVVLTMELIRK